MRRPVAAILLAALAFPALASAPAWSEEVPSEEVRECTPFDLGRSPAEALRAAHVAASAGPRVYFSGDAPGCPSDAAACRARAYLVPGDAVVAGAARGGWRCVSFQGAKRDTTGWLKDGALTLDPVSVPAPEAWLGTWTTGLSEITLTRAAAGALAAEGTSTWPNGMGSANVGDFQGSAVPRGNTLAIGGEDCALRLVRVGAALVVADNNLCGGLNVTFTGVYRRTKGP